MPTTESLLACQLRTDDFDRPGETGGDLANELARLCHACPVLQQCGEWALTSKVEGFAAGMTRSERRRLLRKQVAA